MPADRARKGKAMAPKFGTSGLRGLVVELMPSAMDLAVPLDVETKAGDTWGDME